MEINQMRVSKTITFFKKDLLTRYNFKDYHDPRKPAFFYGVYTKTDIFALDNHKGMKIIIWSGSDINNYKTEEYIKNIKKLKNVHYISNSKYISNSMDSFNILYKQLPICGVDTLRFKAIKKGHCVYIYTSATKPSTYGKQIYEQLISRLPQFKFLIAANKLSVDTAKDRGIEGVQVQYFNKKNMLNVYRKCFIGLRLTEHDGISYTVVEMGLCGIKCIHNGYQPNAMGYNNIDDIVKSIITESKKIGKIDHEVSRKTRNWLNINPNWKKTNFYYKK